jgi:hypothetical protein
MGGAQLVMALQQEEMSNALRRLAIASTHAVRLSSPGSDVCAISHTGRPPPVPDGKAAPDGWAGIPFRNRAPLPSSPRHNLGQHSDEPPRHERL